MPHIHEKIDFTVGIVIVFEGKVLLVNHPRYDKWLTPGGHIELDEDPEQALLREAKEETGLDIEVLSKKPDVQDEGIKFLPAPNYLDIHEANSPHRHIGMVYFAKAKSPDFKLSDEHDDMRWFSRDDLNNPALNISKTIKFYSSKAIEAYET